MSETSPGRGSCLWRLVFYVWKRCAAVHGISEPQSVTCHMQSHSVTCHPTQVNAPYFKPQAGRQGGRYSVYLPGRDERLSLLEWWLYTKMVYSSVDSRPSCRLWPGRELNPRLEVRYPIVITPSSQVWCTSWCPYSFLVLAKAVPSTQRQW